jgi:Leucine rich repeat
LAALFATASAQNEFPFLCNFVIVGENYDCMAQFVSIPEEENFNIIFQGTHLPGRGDGNVTRIFITSSIFPVVITQLWTRFLGVHEYHFTESTFDDTRIQAGAFANAQSLRAIVQEGTRTTGIVANSFNGAPNVERLSLARNLLTNLPANALNGLGNLRSLDLSQNQIQTVAETFFRPSTLLGEILLDVNLIRRIPSTLFSTNVQLQNVQINSNAINEIGPRILDNLTNLRFLSLSNNQCISNSWSNIGTTGPSKDTIRNQLSLCFENYGTDVPLPPPGGKRNYYLVLRGLITLYDMDGNLVGRL